MKKLLQNLSMFLFVAFMTFSVGCTAEAKAGNLSGAVMDYTNLCVYKSEIYYSVGSDLYKLNPSAKSTKLIKSFPEGDSTLSSFSIDGGKMYLTVNPAGGRGGESYDLYSLDLKSKKLKKLAKGRCGVISGKYIYYIRMKKSEYEDVPTGIYRMNKSGSGQKKLYSGAAYSLAVNKGRLYFYDGKLKSMKLNGKNVKTEVSGLSHEDFLGIDKNYLYYCSGTGYENKNVYRQKVGSSSKKLIVSNVAYADVHDNTLYYIKNLDSSYYGKKAVYKKNLKSGKASKIYTAVGIRNMECCGRWLFLTKFLGAQYVSGPNTQNFVITTSGKKVKDLQKFFVS